MAGRLRRPAGRRMGMLLAIAALAAAAPGAPAWGRSGALARPASAPPLGGVNVIGLYSGVSVGVADHEIAAARRLHARVVRAELWWSALEPQRPNQIDPSALAFTDRLVADAAAAGMRVIFAVDSTPCWASSAPVPVRARCEPGHSTPANRWPPTSAAAYAATVAYVARRYGPNLAAIEIWNEPDQRNEVYFAGPEKPQRYAAIVRSAYTAIKQADPRVTVLAGSLVGSNGRFLRALYAAGIRGYYDGLAVHFYNLVLGSLRSIREVQLSGGDNKPLWLDEFGWSSCYPAQRIQEEQPCVTAPTQARNLADVIRSLSGTPWVAAEVVYNLRNAPGEDFGLIDASGALKPAFAALAKALARPSAPSDPVTIALHRRGGHVVASGSGPVGDYMELEALIAGALRYRALFVLDRFDRYSIPLPSVLGSRGISVRVYQYWAGAGGAAQRGI